MELITPSVDIWEQDTSSPIEGMYAHIARCTRVCYQSESNLKPGETPEDFVNRVILRHDPWNSEANHLAMLEHGTVYLKFYRSDVAYRKFDGNPYTKITMDEDYRYVTTNFRVIIENNLLWHFDKYVCAPTEHHARRITVSFTTNIGVTREFNRHRVNSIAEESTRYCNYNKRNDGQIKIGLPAWLDNERDKSYLESHQFDSLESYCEELLNGNNDINPQCWCDIDFYLFALTTAEWCYNNLISKGWKPQQAREVLPLATKSQLIHTAFVDDWKHFFALRADGVSGPTHPNARLLAKPLKEEFIKRNYI